MSATFLEKIISGDRGWRLSLYNHKANLDFSSLSQSIVLNHALNVHTVCTYTSSITLTKRFVVDDNVVRLSTHSVTGYKGLNFSTSATYPPLAALRSRDPSPPICSWKIPQRT